MINLLKLLVMKAILRIIEFAYATILRKLVVKAIDDPESEVDDFILELLDRLFNYKQND